MGRDEQLLVTDQDNAIILDESYQEEKHGKYFEDPLSLSVTALTLVVTNIVPVTSWPQTRCGE